MSPPTRQDEPVLALLPGALIEPSRDLLARLGWSRRVVPLGYADATSMSELTDALAARLAEAGVGRADVLGSSYGGWVAQCLAQRHPALVRDLVLVHTFALRAADARRFRLGLKLWKLMPRASFGLLGAARVKRLLRPLRAASPADYGRVEAQLVEAIRSPATIDALWRQNLCMLESCTAFAENLPRARRVLIVESDDDPAVGADDRARLRARFPGAAVRTFHGTGHITALVAPEAYAEAVNAFLDSRV